MKPITRVLLLTLLFLIAGITPEQGLAITSEQLLAFRTHAEAQGKLTPALAQEIQIVISQDLEEEMTLDFFTTMKRSPLSVQQQMQAELKLLQDDPATHDRFSQQMQAMLDRLEVMIRDRGEQNYWREFFTSCLSIFLEIEAHLKSPPATHSSEAVQPAPLEGSAHWVFLNPMRDPDPALLAQLAGGGSLTSEALAGAAPLSSPLSAALGGGGAFEESASSASPAKGGEADYDLTTLTANRRRALEQQAREISPSVTLSRRLAIHEFKSSRLWSVDWVALDGKKMKSELGSLKNLSFGPKYSVAFSEHQGLRKTMEDAVLSFWPASGSHPLSALGIEDYGILGILDGHGGAEISKKGVEFIPGILTSFLAALTPEQIKNPDLVRKTLENAFSTEGSHPDVPSADGVSRITLDQALHQYCMSFHSKERRLQCLSTGSTALLGVILNQSLYIVNLGDSRAILLGSDGQPQRTAYEHKPEDPGETAAIISRGGFVTPETAVSVARTNGYLSISRSLGDWLQRHSEEVPLPIGRKPEVIWVDLATEKPKALILTCDGVPEGIPSDLLIGQIVRERMKEDLLLAVRDLSAFSLAGGSTDNLSSLVLDFQWGVKK